MARLLKKVNNKGLTLLEMIVAFAVLGLVIAVVGLIISTGSATYSSITTDINLQYESQLAMSQLQEYVIDGNAYVAAASDGSSLYIFNSAEGGGCEAYKFSKPDSANELYLYHKTIDPFDKNDVGIFDFSHVQGQPMSSYVESFSARIAGNVRSVEITLALKSGEAAYTGTQIIAFRNPVEALSPGTGP